MSTYELIDMNVNNCNDSDFSGNTSISGNIVVSDCKPHAKPTAKKETERLCPTAMTTIW
jgi:hypothetical protein